MIPTRAAFPTPTRREAAVSLLLLLWLEAGYALALRLLAGLAWPAALWQAAVCVLAGGVLLLAVIVVLSAPKKLARVSQAAYRAAGPFMGLAQYGLPWLGWAALIWWLNGGDLAPFSALRSGAAVSLFSYLTGLAVVVRLRPRASEVEITRTDVVVDRLPPAFEGYQILHLSDLHSGSWLSRASLSERLAAAGSLAPDLVVFTGDLAARPDLVEEAAAALGELAARDGMVAVLGNHDHWIGEGLVSNALAEAGVRVLANEHMALEREGERLYFVGVEDCCYVGRDDLPGALRGIPDGAPVIIATHSPDIVFNPLSARALLTLSGHTHGGQIVFPWVGPLYVPTKLGRRRMSGLLSVDGRLLYVNRGLGEIFPPMRLHCPPELALLTLHRAPGSV